MHQVYVKRIQVHFPVIPYSSVKKTGSRSAPCLFCFLPRTDGRKYFFSEKTFPPIRSSDEWGVHQLIGLFIGPYLVSEYLTVRLLRHYIDFENFDPNCALPIPKTSKYTQSLSQVITQDPRVAHHSEICFVFGPSQFAVLSLYFVLSSERCQGLI